MNTLECPAADLDTAVGGGIEFFAWFTRGYTSLRGGTEEASSQKTCPTINTAAAGNGEQLVYRQSGGRGALRSATGDRWKEFRVADTPRISGGHDLTGANELAGPAGFGLDAPQTAWIEDCAGWATHYWVERK